MCLTLLFVLPALLMCCIVLLLNLYVHMTHSQFIEGLTHFINHVRELNKKKPFWQFLWMMPLLHFLTEDTTPFAIPPPNNQSTGKNLERWWGVHYLKGSGFEFGEMYVLAFKNLHLLSIPIPLEALLVNMYFL